MKKNPRNKLADLPPDKRGELLNPLKGSILYEGDLISPAIDTDEWHCASARAGADFEPGAYYIDPEIAKAAKQ
jgi:hypothetical protein